MKEFCVIFFIFLSVNTNSEVRAERETRPFEIYGTIESEISSALNGGGLQKSEFVINTEVNAELNKNLNLSELSMGMSSDYLDAIRNGATYVRIGSNIFGQRS